MKSDETHGEHTLIAVLGITTLVFLILVGVASAAPFAYIANMESNNVSVIDTDTNTVTATVNVGTILLELQSTLMEQKYM